MNVLVTGAAGFLGAHAVRRLLDDGWAVTARDLVPPDEAWRLDALAIRGHAGLRYEWGGVEDVRSLGGATHVVHCAAATDVGNTAANPMTALGRTVPPTVALLEAARRSDALERFVLVSSHSVYGNQAVQPIWEDVVPAPGNLYGALKVMQEQAAQAYQRSYGVPVAVVRSATLFGAHIRAGAVVRTFLERALRDEAITVSGDGRQSRDLNHVENTVDGLMAALDRPGAVGGVFNVGSGVDVSILSLAERCIALMGGGRVEHVPSRPGEEGRLSLALDRAGDVLGYKPRIALDEGLGLTAEWVRTMGGR